MVSEVEQVLEGALLKFGGALGFAHDDVAAEARDEADFQQEKNEDALTGFAFAQADAMDATNVAIINATTRPEDEVARPSNEQEGDGNLPSQYVRSAEATKSPRTPFDPLVPGAVTQRVTREFPPY